MVKRKKRLEKGIESIEKQIEIHYKKRDLAMKEGKIELMDYYDREIIAKKKAKEEKEKLLEKQ